jgi:hypothetical protein
MKLLTENKKVRISEGLKFHLENKTPIYENVYRFGSKNYFRLINEARTLYKKGLLEVSSAVDKWMLEKTDIGKTGTFEGKIVMLDIPIVITEESLELQHMKLLSKAMKAFAGSKKQKEIIKQLNPIRTQLGYEPLKELTEAEYQGRDVELGKPQRSSGPKKYQVYVKNDKGNVIKVNFGDAKGGLTAKINDPEARKAFADRHNCKDKKDRTSAGYWSCNLPRYWKALGGGENMNTYW